VIPLGVVIPLFSALLSTVVVLFIVLAIIILSGKREVTFIILTAIVVGQAAVLISGQDRLLLTTWLNAGTKLLAVVALSWLVLTVVFGPGRVTLHRVRGAIILYLNIAVAFSILYELAVALSPGALSGIASGTSQAGLHANTLYFSFTTLTTTGYGDITPIQPIARSLATLIGQLYPTTFLARIVTLLLQVSRDK
jgi:hypothetical protein